MRYEEITNQIKGLKTEKEIADFIQNRLAELEQSCQDVTIGQNYTDAFDGFIGGKTKYKATARFGNVESPDLVYDDNSIYTILINNIQKMNPDCHMTYMFTTILHSINDYFMPTINAFDTMLERFTTYSEHLKDGVISIKAIKDAKVSMCSERAGLAHNIMQFLGMDCELIGGKRIVDESNPVNHAYCAVYYKSKEQGNILIFDPSFSIDCKDISTNKRYSFAYCSILKDDNLTSFKQEGVATDNSQGMANYYLQIHNKPNWVIEEYEKPTYNIGLKQTVGLNNAVRPQAETVSI